MTRSIRIALVCALAAVGTARADEVRFTNGDRLTGTIKRVDDGSLTIKTDVAGEVVVEMKDVATFATSAPAELHLTDGTVLRQQVEAGEAGEVVTRESAAVSGQHIPLDRIATVNPGYGQWKGSISAGGLITRGNSDTESANVAAEAVRRTETDRFSLAGQYIYGRQKDEDGTRHTTANAWRAVGKYDYFITEKVYPYGSVTAERDQVADLDLRFIPAAGVGYQWVESDPLNLFTEVGIAWVYEDFSNAPSEQHVAARLAYHVDYSPHSAVTLFHDLEFLPSLEDINDFNSYTDAGLRVSLLASLFSELKFEWRHDASPAPGAEQNDFRYILSLGWTFE